MVDKMIYQALHFLCWRQCVFFFPVDKPQLMVVQFFIKQTLGQTYIALNQLSLLVVKAS